MRNKLITFSIFFRKHIDLLQIGFSAIIIAIAAVSPIPVIMKSIITVGVICLLLIQRTPFQSTSPIPVIKICFATAIGIITVCSKSSFLYPLNDWVDANCFFTVGKSMLNGIIPYRDILEQKGPFLYFLHGIAWLISNDTFIGVYLIEIISATFFLFFSYRTIQIFYNLTIPVLIIPIYAVIIYTSNAFCHGDSVEELFLPFFAYSLWLGMEAVVNKRNISKKEFLWIGIGSGLIFWSKFTLVGFYLGWYFFLTIAFLKKKRWKDLFSSALFIFLGVAISTIPFVIYFGIHSAIKDWLTVYLYDNLFIYPANTAQTSITPNWINNIGQGIFSICICAPNFLLLPVIGILFLLKKKRNAGYYLLVTFLFTIVFTYIGGRYYTYYAFIFALFIPFDFIPIIEAGISLCKKKVSPKAMQLCLIAVTSLCIALSIKLTPNRYLMGTEKNELPQYAFASIIGEIESPSLLNYGFLDGGFYTASNTLPNCKVFCKLNIRPEELQAIQDTYVAQSLVDFIVTRNEEPAFDNYKLIAKQDFIFEDVVHTYFLYGLR